MINTINILLHLIITVSLLNYILLIIVLFLKLNNKSNNIYQYKIYSFGFNYIVLFTYIIIFVFSIYIWRIFNLNYELNIKHLSDNIHRIWLIKFSHINIFYQIYLMTIIIIIIISFSFLFFKIHKIGSTSLYKFYLYYYYNNANYSLKNQIHLTLSLIGSQDIITYLVSKMSYKITEKFDNQRLITKTLPWYHFYNVITFIVYHKYTETQIIIKLSPIIIIIYDIVFNDYIINHLYFYLMFYMPIMIFKRITTCCVQNATELCKVLYNLYYAKEENILYAINKKDKITLDLFLMSGLKSNLELLNTQFYLKSVIRFTPQHLERNTWVNSNGDYIVLTAESRVFEELEEEFIMFDIKTNDGLIAFRKSGEILPTKIICKLGEEWFLLCHKK